MARADSEKGSTTKSFYDSNILSDGPSILALRESPFRMELARNCHLSVVRDSVELSLVPKQRVDEYKFYRRWDHL